MQQGTGASGQYSGIYCGICGLASLHGALAQHPRPSSGNMFCSFSREAPLLPSFLKPPPLVVPLFQPLHSMFQPLLPTAQPQFFMEKNPTIVNFPVKNLELAACVPVPQGARGAERGKHVGSGRGL